MQMQRSGVVTLLTDFGHQDPYVGIMKGVILNIAPALRLIDLTHGIVAQDVQQGALALESAWRYFPEGTVHLAVVDPGVGSVRHPLLIEAAGHAFVGPDNGLLEAAFQADPHARAYVLSHPAYRLERVSRTFHGRDLFAPAAAHWSKGVPGEAFGPLLPSPVRQAFSTPYAIPGGYQGEIIGVDVYGNLLTNLSGALLRQAPVWRVRVAERMVPVVQTYADVAPGALLALEGSTGRLELSVREGSAAALLEVGRHVPVILEAAELE